MSSMIWRVVPVTAMDVNINVTLPDATCPDGLTLWEQYFMAQA